MKVKYGSTGNKKIYCQACNMEITKGWLNEHCKSKSHIDKMNGIEKVIVGDLFHCEVCNCDITRQHRARHFKSPKHQNNLAKNSVVT
jgi:hypothetical protein